MNFPDNPACIQIGLHHSAELIFLANYKFYGYYSDVQDIIKDNIPFDIGDCNWNYLGVDSDPASITKQITYFEHMDNVKWLCAYIMDKTGSLGSTNSWDSILGQWPVFHFSPLPLDDLVKEYLNSIGKSSLEILTMDIDGGEYKVFENYSWDIKPFYILIEDHLVNNEKEVKKLFPDQNIPALSDILIPNGYTELEPYTLKNGDLHRGFVRNDTPNIIRNR